MICTSITDSPVINSRYFVILSHLHGSTNIVSVVAAGRAVYELILIVLFGVSIVCLMSHFLCISAFLEASRQYHKTTSLAQWDFEILQDLAKFCSVVVIVY